MKEARMKRPDISEFEKIFDNLEIGEKVTIRETEENTYVRRKNSLQLLSSKKVKAEKIK